MACSIASSREHPALHSDLKRVTTKQRIVDAHAQPDQGRELGREVRRVDDVADQGDDAQRAAERQQCCDQREGRRHQRSEREQKHDRRGEDAHALRGALALAEAHHLGAGTAVLDLERLAAGRKRGILDVLQVVGLDVVRALPVVQRGDPDPAVFRQAPTLAERARDAGHVALRTNLPERRLDALSVGRVLERAVARLVDDLVGVALGGGKVLGEQVVRALALGARQPEARDLLDADARGDDLDQDQGQQPDPERAPAVPVAQPGEPDEA